MAEQVTRSLKMAGLWWLPDNYENRLMGTLTWEPNQGCFLRLVDDHDFNWDSSPRIIVGMNSDQDAVTLLGCRHAGHAGFKMTGNVSSDSHWVQVNCALIGGYFEDETEIALTDLYIEYAGLDEYVTAKYYDIDRSLMSDGNYALGPIIFTIPTYEMAKIGQTEVGLYLESSFPSGIQLNHKLHFSFSEGHHYRSEGTNFRLVHEVIPALLSAIMGHQSFLTSLGSHIDKKSVEIFDGYHERKSWDGNSRFRDRLVHGTEKTFALWPAILPAWVNNYEPVANLCRAYVKILTDGEDGFFDINNLVHLFFGIESYHKTKCGLPKSSLEKALCFSVKRISEYFENADKFTLTAGEVDVNSLVRARQVLVHANEGEPDYSLVFQQLMLITRCVFLMEMEYPVANVQQDTSHWTLWSYFAQRSKKQNNGN